jgi:hypothetical protein
LTKVAVDFDGTLAEGGILQDGAPLAWRPGARELVDAAAAPGSGVQMVLHTCRATTGGRAEAPGEVAEFLRSGRVPDDVELSWRLRDEMVDFLRREGVRAVLPVWEGPGKPIADVYPDDRGAPPDLRALARGLGLALPSPHAQGPQRSTAPVGQPGPLFPSV